MGIALEEAPAPEAGGTRINGEVPAVDEAISRELSDAVPVILDKRSLEVIQNSPDGCELVVPIPAEDSAIPHQVPLEGMEMEEDFENRRYLFTFRTTLREKFEENKTIGLSLTAAAIAVGGVYAIQRQIRK
jgi:hypothetical protein